MSVAPSAVTTGWRVVNVTASVAGDWILVAARPAPWIVTFLLSTTTCSV